MARIKDDTAKVRMWHLLLQEYVVVPPTARSHVGKLPSPSLGVVPIPRGKWHSGEGIPDTPFSNPPRNVGYFRYR